ncbi:MAG: hypothetical protein KL840_13980 [Aquamicrobium sp.]|nr:hypothetical protein [Aquamicrobium sp.]
MRHGTMLAAAALTVLSVAPSAAQDVERYRLERTDDGYVRLDTTTGRTTLCQERSGQLICKMAVEERSAFEGQIDDLEARVEALEDRLATLEAGGRPEELPSEEEFEQTLGYMERFFRRFMGLVDEFEREDKTTQPEPPADRT